MHYAVRPGCDVTATSSMLPVPVDLLLCEMERQPDENKYAYKAKDKECLLGVL